MSHIIGCKIFTMKKYSIFTLFLLSFISFSNISCFHNPYDDSESTQVNLTFFLKDLPTDCKPDNVTLFFQMPPSEGAETTFHISNFSVTHNNQKILEEKSLNLTLFYNVWTEDQDGTQIQKSNYQNRLFCIPENYPYNFNIGDCFEIKFTYKTNRPLKNEINFWLVDNTEVVGWWKTLSWPEDSPVIPPQPPVQQDPVIETELQTKKLVYKLNSNILSPKQESITLFIQQSSYEGSQSILHFEDFIVRINGTQVNRMQNFDTTLYFNQWDTGSNFQGFIYTLPQNLNKKLNAGDLIELEFTFKPNRKLYNHLQYILINFENYQWIEIGDETCSYPPKQVPAETITYNNKKYKLIFNEDFNTDHSSENSLKNGVYYQPHDLNNWFAEDWGNYNSNNYEYRSVEYLKIHDGIAEFPLVRKASKKISGPCLITAKWTGNPINTTPIHTFNKGIYEIRFKGPDTPGYHPGQFTFWVLNYNTDFEAKATNGRIPTNQYRASDGYALDEIDFFEYSPSRNIIRTGCRSSNSINSRPAAGYMHYSLPSDFTNYWHTFRCVWDDSGLTSFLDGKQISFVSSSSIKGFNNPNDKFMLLITSQAITESGIDGNLDADFNPYSFYVDYIKVYQIQ